MARSTILISTLCLLLMLVFATEMVAEARECEHRSPHYYGACFANNNNMNNNCNSICQCDGFDRGFCRLTNCFCGKKC